MFFSEFIRYVRLFSLDIIAGALASLVFASAVMDIDIHRSYYLILAITVWLVYTADHLMDAAKTRGESESESRNFFHLNKIPLIFLFLIMLVFDFRLIIYRLDERIIEFAVSPGIAVIVYLVLNRFYGKASKWFFIKEVWIAIIYTLGIWGGPVIYSGDIINPGQALLASSFLLIIFGNVLIYSIYEKEIDEKEDNRSFVRDFGIRTAVNTAIFTVSFSLILPLVALIFLQAEIIQCIPLILISAGLILILSYPRIFTKNQLYGIFADFLMLLFLLVLTG